MADIKAVVTGKDCPHMKEKGALKQNKVWFPNYCKSFCLRSAASDFDGPPLQHCVCMCVCLVAHLLCSFALFAWFILQPLPWFFPWMFFRFSLSLPFSHFLSVSTHPIGAVISGISSLLSSLLTSFSYPNLLLFISPFPSPTPISLFSLAKIIPY